MLKNENLHKQGCDTIVGFAVGMKNALEYNFEFFLTILSTIDKFLKDSFVIL